MPVSPFNKHQRLYRDLAWIWPIISPPEDYIEESEQFSKTILEQSQIEVKTLLDLGCGGGHNDYTMKKHFTVTGVDISTSMLTLAKRLNPEVTYCHGDMRTVCLEKTFDAVAIFDSISYMLTVEDLRAAFVAASKHLKPGGVFLTFVEETSESFQQNKTHCSTHAQGDTGITFIQNAYDPDPTDTTYEWTYVYLIRHSNQLDIETDRHLCGIFRRETWDNLLAEVGFEVKQKRFKPSDMAGDVYTIWVGVLQLQHSVTTAVTSFAQSSECTDNVMPFPLGME